MIQSQLTCLQCINPDDPFPPRDQTLSDSSSGDTSGSSDSELESSGDDEELEDAAGEYVSRHLFGRKAAKDASEQVAQHRQTKTLHLIKSVTGPPMFLACGRRYSDAYEVCNSQPSFEWPKFRTC